MSDIAESCEKMESVLADSASPVSATAATDNYEDESRKGAGVSHPLLGRIVSVKDAPDYSSIESGSHVIIESYNPSTEMFSVRELGDASISPSEEMAMKQFDYDSNEDFSTRFPQAPTVFGSSDLKWPQKECIVDFTGVEIADDQHHPSITIRHSCRVLGGHTPITTELEYSEALHCSVPNKILVETEMDSDIVEFEKILFMFGNQKEEYRVRCNRGNVVFRQCTFHGNEIGVLIGSFHPNVCVRFEKCSFQFHVGCAVQVNAGQVTMLQCNILHVTIGVCVRGTGSLVVHHTNISNSTIGMLIIHNAQCTLHRCSIKEVKDNGITVAMGGTAHIHYCSISESRCDGISIEGGVRSHRTTVLMDYCNIDNCAMNGIKISNGIVDVEIVMSILFRCAFGIYITPSAIGSVIIDQCTVNHKRSYNSYGSIVDISGMKCYVRTDGELRSLPMQAYNIINVIDALKTQCKYRKITGKMDMRVLRQNGIISILCENCKLVEYGKEIYKRCGKCRRARYCSRDCQKEH